MPCPKKSGGWATDDQAAGNFRLLQSIVCLGLEPSRHCADLQVRPGLHCFAVSNAVVCPTAKVFESVTTFGALDDDLKESWIVVTSDMASSDVMKAVNLDPCVVSNLVHLSTQAPMRMMIPRHLLTVEVLRGFLASRIGDCGVRSHFGSSKLGSNHG